MQRMNGISWNEARRLPASVYDACVAMLVDDQKEWEKT